MPFGVPINNKQNICNFVKPSSFFAHLAGTRHFPDKDKITHLPAETMNGVLSSALVKSLWQGRTLGGVWGVFHPPKIYNFV